MRVLVITYLVVFGSDNTRTLLTARPSRSMAIVERLESQYIGLIYPSNISITSFARCILYYRSEFHYNYKHYGSNIVKKNFVKGKIIFASLIQSKLTYIL